MESKKIDLEKVYIIYHKCYDWYETASKLNMSYRTLLTKLKEHGYMTGKEFLRTYK